MIQIGLLQVLHSIRSERQLSNNYAMSIQFRSLIGLSLNYELSIGTAAMIALGCNHPRWESQYHEIGSAAGFYDDYHEGRDPAGISTQDPELSQRLDPERGGRRLANYLRVMTIEAQTIARACGKSHIQNLEPEDLVALDIESAAMAWVPLAGTDWIPGRSRPL
ncbi:glutamate synthase [Salinisphaera orenii MK-B5]|uniref:Glutamate synthase n=1 Tax=Salinisphaera orenii MK-B5 TaxID=856730 RepID=A0A423PF26_9GAMM|nr:glutamate synthase [Salinisphaera orenii MK-B5]